MKYFALAILASCVFLVPTGANAGLLEFLFPGMRKPTEADPSVTLQAPFAVDAQKQEEGEEQAGTKDDGEEPGLNDFLAARGADGKPLMPENAIPLDQPHRSSRSIEEWVMTASSEALMFDKPDFNENLVASKGYFSTQGRQQYIAFLKAQGIEKTLKDGQKDVRSFVQGTPVLLNEGVADGRYKWLYDVDLMLTYLNRGATDYQSVVPENKKVRVRMQIGRSPDAQNRDEIWVETWTGKVSE